VPILKRIALLALPLLTFTGCAFATGGDSVVTGALFSHYGTSGALGTATAAKTGEACATSIVGLIALGDASTTAARQSGGITQISYVEHRVTSVLTLYARTCTVVVGQ